MATTIITVRFEIEGDGAVNAIDNLLDDGVFQDAIVDYESDDGPLQVLSAVTVFGGDFPRAEEAVADFPPSVLRGPPDGNDRLLIAAHGREYVVRRLSESWLEVAYATPVGKAEDWPALVAKLVTP